MFRMELRSCIEFAVPETIHEVHGRSKWLLPVGNEWILVPGAVVKCYNFPVTTDQIVSAEISEERKFLI